MELSDTHHMDFCVILYLLFLIKCLEIFGFWLKSDKTKGTLHGDGCSYDLMSWFLFINKKFFLCKVCGEAKETFFCISESPLIMYTAPSSDRVYFTLLWSCILHPPSDHVNFTLLWSCIIHPPSDHIYFTLLWSCILHPPSDHVYCTLLWSCKLHPPSDHVYFTLPLIM